MQYVPIGVLRLRAQNFQKAFQGMRQKNKFLNFVYEIFCRDYLCKHTEFDG